MFRRFVMLFAAFFALAASVAQARPYADPARPYQVWAADGPGSSQDVALDQRMERLQDRRAGADLVGQGGQADLDALAGEALALPVQRLVLSRTAPSPAGWDRPRRAALCGTAPAAG